MSDQAHGPLLTVEHVSLALKVRGGMRRILQDISSSVRAGESVGLVGESGSGKSMTIKTILRLLPPGAQVVGNVTFDGQPVLSMNGSALRRYRARDVAMIYQDPRVSVNPLRTIEDFLLEGLVTVNGIAPAQAREAAIEQLLQVGIPDAGRRLRQYPHQLSGGLLQRVVIAAALLTQPRLILADEPTTALDVTTQEEVVAILDEQRRERGLAMLFVSHNLDLAAAVTDRIVVMYAGAIVEDASSAGFFETALHPYARGLLAARPGIRRVDRLAVIPGRPAAAFEVGDGCVFVDRCAYADDRCRMTRPLLRPVADHLVACHRVEELVGQGLYEGVTIA